MICAYCHEMNIPENVPECNESLEDVLNDLTDKTSNIEKKIMLLEIMALVKSDSVYDEKETYTTVFNELYSTIFEIERNYI